MKYQYIVSPTEKKKNKKNNQQLIFDNAFKSCYEHWGGKNYQPNAYKTWTRIFDFMRSLSQFVSWIIYTCWENGQYLANLFKKKNIVGAGALMPSAHQLLLIATCDYKRRYECTHAKIQGQGSRLTSSYRPGDNRKCV